jgi:hypothetical protein
MTADWTTMGGHGVIIGMLVWIGRALQKSGVHMSFHIWKNGKQPPE